MKKGIIARRMVTPRQAVNLIRLAYSLNFFDSNIQKNYLQVTYEDIDKLKGKNDPQVIIGIDGNRELNVWVFDPPWIGFLKTRAVVHTYIPVSVHYIENYIKNYHRFLKYEF